VSVPYIVKDMSQMDFEASATGFIISALDDTIAKHGQASLFLSGGSTPGPIYEKLSKVSCEWGKVNIGLVDDRWVNETDKGSNAALIRRTLLKNGAKTATFTPMKTKHETAELGQGSAQERYKSLFKAPAVAVLGMGTDGHVCSWFPQAEGLEAAIDLQNPNHIQAIKASPTKVTGAYLDRISLTLSALESCEKILLLISGSEKRSVFEKAMHSKDNAFPVSYLINMTNAKIANPLTILHAA